MKIAEHLCDAVFCRNQPVEREREVGVGLRQFAADEFDVLKGGKKRFCAGKLLRQPQRVDHALHALIEAAVYELTQGIIPLEGIAIETTTEVTEDKEETDHE